MSEQTNRVGITWDGASRYFAALARRDTPDAPGPWTLHLIDETDNTTEPLVSWDPSPLPVPLVARYDALASMGFAVVQGGVEAWKWRELDGEDGGTSFMGVTEVRPLRPDEVAPATAPTHLTVDM
ncbi:DUF6303 family protein [Streptomyces ossamyceticus]|uniref:DUF6303 family protein n=1 Tax=Streptomyces ossamyceticus TaxID=249581 RepID=UPI003426CCE2